MLRAIKIFGQDFDRAVADLPTVQMRVTPPCTEDSRRFLSGKKPISCKVAKFAPPAIDSIFICINN